MGKIKNYIALWHAVAFLHIYMPMYKKVYRVVVCGGLSIYIYAYVYAYDV